MGIRVCPEEILSCGPEHPSGRAVFTRLDAAATALAPALTRFGLDTIEAL